MQSKLSPGLNLKISPSRYHDDNYYNNYFYDEVRYKIVRNTIYFNINRIQMIFLFKKS